MNQAKTDLLAIHLLRRPNTTLRLRAGFKLPLHIELCGDVATAHDVHRKWF